MSTKKYLEKRDFTQTKEPKSGKSNATKKLRFVVQRHHASHLHYDFRLEMEGVLKSWAVPKGPSLNPKDKRLAMMVEDHPYDYKNFEGEIPKGNYGAGTVTIFDEGFYQSLAKTRNEDEQTLVEGLIAGHLKFNLKGKILKGEFALVRLKNTAQNAWLLIKHKDEYALDHKFNSEELIPAAIIKAGKDFKNKKKKPLVSPPPVTVKAKNYSPMLATLCADIFEDKDWIYERKWDGYRILAYLKEEVKLITRNGKDYSTKYKSIIKELEKVNEKAVLDGELVALDTKGKENFQILRRYPDHQNAILNYYVFDLLALNRYDLTEMPLIQRKQLLKQLLKPYNFKHIQYNEHIEEKGNAFFEKARKSGWEGIIAKNKNENYLEGKRSETWLKFKFNLTQEALICGFTHPEGSRKHFGALVLAIRDENKELHYIGNCGSGFKRDDLKELHELFKQQIVNKKPFKDKAVQEDSITWLKPNLVCEVKFTEWTKDKRLRHPVFKGLRMDKEKSTLEIEIPKEIKVSKKLQNDQLTFGHKKVKLSHIDKIYWPKEKITKGDLINYYAQVSSVILPYLKDKPLSLNRHPEGITKPSFFQKDVNTTHIPKWAKTTKVLSESTQKEIDYLVCNDKPTLLYLANLGCIEINPWLSTYKKPLNPDFMVIDLDPDKNKFSEVVTLALVVKSIYDQMGVISFVKTSGSSGMHIYVYTGAVYDYDFIKEFAHFVAQKVHELSPENTSLERSPSKRKGKIYIDYLQNRRGQTLAAPYSVRPKPQATVSFPLNWSDLTDKLDMNDYHLMNVPKLLNQRVDPWATIFNKKQNLKKALEKFKKAV